MKALFHTFIMLLICVPSVAQSLLPVDSPELYFLYFHFHDRVNSSIQAKKVQPASSETTLSTSEKYFARRLAIDPEELAKVSGIVHQFVVDLEKWNKDLKDLVANVQEQGGQVEQATLETYDQRKLSLIAASVAQLQGILTPASWNGLHSYINEQHRLGTRKY